MLLFCHPTCSTCKKAKAFLDSRAIPYELLDIRTQPPTAQQLDQWQVKSGLPLKRFFNTSGQRYRELELSSRLAAMSREDQLALLASDGMLIKRPLLVAERFVLTGFRQAHWEEILL